MSQSVNDAIIIGGSYAGLSAALQLGRARRRVLIIDEGVRRNRFAAHSHGFLTQDGVDPAVIAQRARDQVLAYPTVRLLSARAERVQRLKVRDEDGAAFDVIADGARFAARRLLLATGVTDTLPAIPGLAERWGRSVFHCPYCHGYELDRGPIAVIAGSALSMHHALMLPDWGPTTLLLNTAFEPDADQLSALSARGTNVERSPVVGITGHADITLADGRTLPFAGIFALAEVTQASPFADQLGLAMDDSPIGAMIRTSATKETSIPGVFACGDAARISGSVALAVGDGNMAGAALHRSLMFESV
ncbi:Thioredoxin reductase [Rhizobium sp. RU20A]|uniref:NAD(P)/FAD-dependent oxidoreductase n=1 Tax=Rhizobium sp. RU20A TaxID=1907412 RepID=UPI000953AD25|nr:NAD(P)/FAD-dependent oxidoreductase [Rhizobium sp. RU20A]SIR09913.1 Thioredoxin reductase [Rhizobium sp. RU20A]